MKIAVFMGGTSSEKEISLRSGEAVLESLQRQGYDVYGVVLDENNQVTAFLENDYDLAYLVLHGGNGENGKIQAVLDILGKKYTGSGVLASALTMDKNKTKQIAENIGIRVPKSYRDLDSIERFPVIIKPVDEGSSKGLFLCNNKEEAGEALKKLRKPIIEDYIVGEELTVGVLNGKALGVLKIIPQADVLYDYDSKYAKGGAKEYVFEFPEKVQAEINKFAQDSYYGLKCEGFARIDFMVVNEETPYFMEVNTSPGMTAASLLPKSTASKGYNYSETLDLLIESSLKVER